MWRRRRQCLEPASASRCRTKARVAPHELSPDRRLCTGGPQTRRPYAPAYSGPSPNPTPVDTADDMHPAYSRPSPSAGGRDHRPHASRVYSRGVSS